MSAPVVASLHVYPVKSLAGIAVAEARLTARGLEHDRRFVVVDAQGEFLTQREHPRMATVWTEIAGDRLRLAAPHADEVELPLRPVGGARLTVRVWNSVCESLAVSPEADRLLSEVLGEPCRLAWMPDSTRRVVNPEYAPEGAIVSFADGFPVLVTTEGSLADLNARLTTPVPMSRFRPNVVLSGTAPWAEDGWESLAAGGVRLRFAKPCGRCQVTTTDQATGEVRGPEPLATLGTFRGSERFGIRFGVNAVPALEGLLRAGDPATLA